MLKGRVEKGVEVGLWIEYDDDGNEIWSGFYRNGKRYSILKKEEGMKGFYSELNMNDDLLSVSEYDENWMKNGRCFEYEEGVLKRECVYEHGMKKRVLREWNDKGMIEYDDNGMRVYEDSVKQYEDGYGNDLSVFDVDCLKGIERLEIGNECLKKVNRFVIDGLNELKSVIIGKKSFELDENKRIGSECVIMNCDQLNEIHFGYQSFYWYELFELKNLPSLISIQLDGCAFRNCQSIVFDSMND